MSSGTLHSRISDDLRKRIIEGKLTPGQKLPSEAELGREYDVSRITVRQALRTLEQEGLVAARAGLGRIVRARRNMVYRPQQEKEPRISSTMDRFMAGLVQDGRKPSQSIEIAVEQAKGIVAERFGVPEGTPVVARKRVRWIDDEPYNINDTFYLHSVAKDTAVMEPADLPQGSNSVIENILGREVKAIDEFYVRMPTPEETSRLDLSAGTPVAVHYVTGYTADDKVVRVEYFVLPGDRHVILFQRDHHMVEP
ncbi:GntR family transcriptional regulator [Saccharopolyspora spinosa]|uniref:GntR family transcriptional regulator n=1 Tax=Saccharopolyspora spinosa TaxID=60894 RepID=A0A2N3XT59_SACSN|nr:GntR family transcriptional regulator [Saccharopolyspora spinosa]PKW13829.1 GntR family transcriptional regulator [Saccharopolyspora spinosa]